MELVKKLLIIDLFFFSELLREEQLNADIRNELAVSFFIPFFY